MMESLADEPEPTGHRRARRGTAGPLPGGDPRIVEFSLFYQDFVPSLMGFLIWQGAESSLAAEIVQETMTTLFRSWPHVEHRHAWARRIASRAYARQIARVEQDPVDTAPEHRSPLLGRDTDPDLLVARHEALRFLELLPTRQRQVMAWTLDGHTPTEIAIELKIEPGAVRASLQTARRTLASHLAATLKESEDR
jgi:RNA polymerase sigma-70 factor (ECF subfamily)